MSSSVLPKGYRVEEISGGCRQHFPGGYREYNKVRGGYITHTVTDGTTISHEELNKIFKNSLQFQESKLWNDGFPFKLRSRTAELEKELSAWKTAAKAGAILSLFSISLLGYKCLSQ